MSKIPFKQRLSPEMKLLLVAARPFMTDAEGQELGNLCTPDVVWPEFLSLINRHRLPGLPFYNLNHYAKARLPTDIYQSLQQQAEKNRRNELALSAEMVRLNRLFKGNGIKVIFFKGPILSRQVYGSLGLRHSRDIDALILPTTFEAANQVLNCNGYKIQEASTADMIRKKRSFTRLYHHFGYIHPQRGYLLELHWQLANNPFYLPPDFEQKVCEQAANIDFGSESLTTLSMEDNFIYLCAHGAFHGWFRLKWLCDITAYLRSPQILDWDNLSERIVRMGLQRPVAQAAYLANQLLDAPLPIQLREVGEQEHSLFRLIGMAEEFMLRSEEETYATGKLNKMVIGFYRMRLRRDIKFKSQTLLQIWVNREDWREFPLPASLSFLYFLLRPFFWLYRYYGRGGSSRRKSSSPSADKQ